MAKKTTKRAPASKAKHEMQRADFGASADPYYEKIAPPDMKAAATKLRALIRKTVPGAREAIKWGMPMYERNGMLCYVKACRGYIRFGFYGQDAGITDPECLAGGGGKQLRHIRVTSPSDVRPALFAKWIKQAARVNEAK